MEGLQLEAGVVAHAPGGIPLGFRRRRLVEVDDAGELKWLVRFVSVGCDCALLRIVSYFC